MENWEEKFDAEFKCSCFLCAEKDHGFSTTATYMKEWIKKNVVAPQNK